MRKVNSFHVPAIVAACFVALRLIGCSAVKPVPPTVTTRSTLSRDASAGSVQTESLRQSEAVSDEHPVRLIVDNIPLYDAGDPETASYPRIHHPDPQIAALLEKTISRRARDMMQPDGSRGSCRIHATTHLVSGSCYALRVGEKDRDPHSQFYGQYIGGAAAEPDVWAFNYRIEGGTLRELSLRDMLRASDPVPTLLAKWREDVSDRGAASPDALPCRPSDVVFWFDGGFFFSCPGMSPALSISESATAELLRADVARELGLDPTSDDGGT